MSSDRGYERSHLFAVAGSYPAHADDDACDETGGSDDASDNANGCGELCRASEIAAQETDDDQRRNNQDQSAA